MTYFLHLMDTYYIYIMANKENGTLYIGSTTNLLKRVYEHKNKLVEGFTQKYEVHNLVYYEQVDDFKSATERERGMKKWNRHWKTRLIETMNPEWKDLYEELVK